MASETQLIKKTNGSTYSPEALFLDNDDKENKKGLLITYRIFQQLCFFFDKEVSDIENVKARLFLVYGINNSASLKSGVSKIIFVLRKTFPISINLTNVGCLNYLYMRVYEIAIGFVEEKVSFDKREIMVGLVIYIFLKKFCSYFSIQELKKENIDNFFKQNCFKKNMLNSNFFDFDYEKICNKLIPYLNFIENFWLEKRKEKSNVKYETFVAVFNELFLESYIYSENSINQVLSDFFFDVLDKNTTEANIYFRCNEFFEKIFDNFISILKANNLLEQLNSLDISKMSFSIEKFHFILRENTFCSNSEINERIKVHLLLLFSMKKNLNKTWEEFSSSTNDVKLINHSLYHFPLTLVDLQNISDLDLSYNRISLIPEQISSLVNLKYLSLRGNSISFLPTSITFLSELRVLDLRDNKITRLFQKGINGNINPFKKITKLLLDRNQIVKIGREIKLFSGLTTLSLRQNKVSFVNNCISELHNLSIVDLSRNKLKSLPKILSVTELIISTNPIKNINILGQMTHLVILNLNNTPVEALPDTFFKSIQIIHLKGNVYNQQNPKFFESSL